MILVLFITKSRTNSNVFKILLTQALKKTYRKSRRKVSRSLAKNPNRTQGKKKVRDVLTSFGGRQVVVFGLSFSSKFAMHPTKNLQRRKKHFKGLRLQNEFSIRDANEPNMFLDKFGLGSPNTWLGLISLTNESRLGKKYDLLHKWDDFKQLSFHLVKNLGSFD